MVVALTTTVLVGIASAVQQNGVARESAARDCTAAEEQKAIEVVGPALLSAVPVD